MIKGLQHIPFPVARKVSGYFGLAALILFTLTPVIIWSDPNRFQMFFHQNLLYGITVLFLLLLFLFSVMLIRALGYQAPVLTVLAFQVVVTFFMYFAPTPGATGIAEGGYGLLFAQLVQRQDIALLILAWRFLTVYVGVAIGVVVMYRELFQGGKASRT